jgi:hypothetical protein
VGLGQYEKLIRNNLDEAFQRSLENLSKAIPARTSSLGLHFKAFGEECIITPDRVILSDQTEQGPRGLIISLYAKHVGPEPCQIHPFRAYKDHPGSMPYHGAFRANSEIVLVPHVEKIHEKKEIILSNLNGRIERELETGDFAFVLLPLPKIALGYVFYLPDDEFPASVTCLISANASSFIPLDGLADVAEYCSKKIIQILKD